MPAGAVYVGRPSRWGNPYKVGRRDFEGRPIRTVEDVIAAYRRWVVMFKVTAARRELAGRDLACWCPLDQPCHADVLLQVANQPEVAR
jgi:hypothetical protein